MTNLFKEKGSGEFNGGVETQETARLPYLGAPHKHTILWYDNIILNYHTLL